MFHKSDRKQLIFLRHVDHDPQPLPPLKAIHAVPLGPSEEVRAQGVGRGTNMVKGGREEKEVYVGSPVGKLAGIVGAYTVTPTDIEGLVVAIHRIILHKLYPESFDFIV